MGATLTNAPCLHCPPPCTVYFVGQVFALVVFMLGFFLTRQEVPHFSHCQVSGYVMRDSDIYPAPGLTYQ